MLSTANVSADAHGYQSRPTEEFFRGTLQQRHSLKQRGQLPTTSGSVRCGGDLAEHCKAALEAGGRAVISLDGSGRVRAVSPAVESLLAGTVHIRRSQLSTADPLLQERLSALVQAAIRYDPWRSEPMPPPVILPGRPGRAIHVDALPMPSECRVLADISAFILFREVEDGADLLATTLKSKFGLTQAEVRLALMLADGISLQHAAENIGVRESTARAQLKAIFSKTNTHRQAMLVALLARIGLGLPTGGEPESVECHARRPQGDFVPFPARSGHVDPGT